MSGCFIATGVRWAESVRRNNTRGIMEISHRNKEKRIILTSDNDEKRQLFETCNLKGKMTVNPIVDWSNADVWGYIHSESLPINPLYQCGFERVGCVGCPLGGYKHQCRDFARYPKFKKAYDVFEEKIYPKEKQEEKPVHFVLTYACDRCVTSVKHEAYMKKEEFQKERICPFCGEKLHMKEFEIMSRW